VPYVSSGGLRVILEWEQIMEDRSGQFKMLHVNDNIKKVLDLTGLLSDITIE
jgi:anti-anti-sigma factor